MALLLIFATGLGWFPTFGMVTAGRDLRIAARAGSPTSARHLVLPVATVALGLIGQYAIVMRSSIIETLSEDYVTTARAKGLRDDRVLRRHALPERAAADRHARSRSTSATSWPARSPSRSSSTGRASGTLTVEALVGARLPGPAGRLPAPLACRSCSPTSAPTSLYGLLDPRVRT